MKALQREAAAYGRSTEAELQAIAEGMGVTRNVKDFVGTGVRVLSPAG